MNIEKARKRDKKRQKRIHGMRVDGAFLKEIKRIQKKRVEIIRNKRKEKEERLEKDD
jgi:hypothetical protein